MPTYEYECTKGHQFEVEQRITESPLERCQVCRAKVRRLISASTFILKGGGWYSDGYSSESGSSSSSSSSSENGTSKSKSSTGSSDSKSSTPKEPESKSSSAGSSD